MAGCLRRGGHLALRALRTGHQGSELPTLSAAWIDSALAGPETASRLPPAGLLSLRSGFASLPHQLHADDQATELASLLGSSSAPLEAPPSSTAAELGHAAGEPGASSSLEPAQLLDSGPAGVDPAQILEVTRFAEQDALLAAWTDSGWNIFNAAFQALLTSAQELTGLPWWATITLTALAARTLLLPVTVSQVRNTHRMSQARPDMLALRDWYTQETERGNPQAKTQYQTRMAQVWQKHNCNPLKSLGSIFVQIPLFVGFFGSLRSLAAAKVPSLTDGGTLWFTDLTIADPTYAMPILCSAMIWLTVELGAADGMQGQDPALMRNMKLGMRFVSVILVPMTASMPQGVFVYWITSSVWSLGQAAVFKIAGVRTRLGLPPLHKMPATTTTGIPVTGIASMGKPVMSKPVVGKPVTTYKLKPPKKGRQGLH